ncbi:hypothetical protein ACFQ05_11610 [Amycolatopsis umgeniensis]|uniref:IrrE N-terminal-like domain-containing protein n=1 Tax=Amycolatopsis umgeniensis TaxID=336628 RepID=A0A841B1F8_9PSEU|nr:hypothetical protein [Amycolatopsis umgeniensis]MBB5853946.1 hypothetical protein [Amycolatopsis umgeniensis]
MEWGRVYDPYRHAEVLGAEVIVSSAVTGWGDYGGGRIRVHPILHQAEARCTVAHEIVHHERRDDVLGYCGVAWLDSRLERRVHAIAARRLIIVPELADALLWSDDPGEIAEQLVVDPRTLYVRVVDLSTSEYREIGKQIRGRSPRSLGDLRRYAARQLRRRAG